jgi:hypothetical protein
MSEKYSTAELVDELMRHWVGIGDCFKKRDIIIAQLRAADALISAVREESPLSVNVRKAIADYEKGDMT